MAKDSPAEPGDKQNNKTRPDNDFASNLDKLKYEVAQEMGIMPKVNNKKT